MGWKANAPSDFVWAGGVMAGIVCLQDAGAIVKRRAAVRAKDVPGPKPPLTDSSIPHCSLTRPAIRYRRTS